LSSFRVVFPLLLPAFALALAAGCSGTVGSSPAPAPTASGVPAGTLLTGAATELPFVSQGQAGAILVPTQIDVPPSDYAVVIAGPSPQASMPPIPLVPGPYFTRTIVYTAVTFTRLTTTQRQLGLRFDLPKSIDPNFGTFYLAAYHVHGSWRNVGSTHVASGQEVEFSPAAPMTRYAAIAPHGVALYQLVSIEQPGPQPSPQSVQLDAVGHKATVTLQEPDYYAKWSAVSTDPKVATVSPAYGGPRFTITARKAGKTSIAFRDSAGGTGTVSVGVTTSGGGIH
jgi:hypothetical protein